VIIQTGMRIITKDEFTLDRKELSDAITKGAVFVYPTDTIYGIGCNALDDRSVARIRELKSRSAAPFSVIAPSAAWIRQHCHVSPTAEKWLEKLPGPYTLILRMKDKSCVAKEVTQGLDTLGVRIPAHWISKAVTELGFPVVTTSVNKTGKEYMNSIDDMDPEIKANVDFIIDEGEKRGKPSTIVHLEEEKVMVKERR